MPTFFVFCMVITSFLALFIYQDIQWISFSLVLRLFDSCAVIPNIWTSSYSNYWRLSIFITLTSLVCTHVYFHWLLSIFHFYDSFMSCVSSSVNYFLTEHISCFRTPQHCWYLLGSPRALWSFVSIGLSGSPRHSAGSFLETWRIPTVAKLGKFTRAELHSGKTLNPKP